MARPLRIEYPGAVYHVTTRGNGRERIFLDDSDREAFLDIVSDVASKHKWLLYSYCLMDNHYHLVLETVEGNLSRGMRQLNGISTQSFNRRHQRMGHIYQGRYKAILVDRDSYLQELCRYVELNPVRAGIVRVPSRWKWSSYRAMTGQDKTMECLQREWVLSLFSHDRERAVSRYEEFIAAGINKAFPWEDLKGQIILGSSESVEALRDGLLGREEIKEIPKAQRHVGRPRLEEIFKETASTEKRDKAIAEAFKKYGYTLREIGDYLGIHYSTVSHAAKRGAVVDANRKT